MYIIRHTLFQEGDMVVSGLTLMWKVLPSFEIEGSCSSGPPAGELPNSESTQPRCVITLYSSEIEFPSTSFTQAKTPIHPFYIFRVHLHAHVRGGEDHICHPAAEAAVLILFLRDGKRGRRPPLLQPRLFRRREAEYVNGGFFGRRPDETEPQLPTLQK